ncbi:MAG: RNA-binding protein [Anaerovoracaceae bacterium]
MNDDKLTIAAVQDRQDRCESNYMITNTNFLDMHQQAVCQNAVKSRAMARAFFYGGYEQAERRVMVFLPDYIEVKDEKELHEYFLENTEECPMAVIRASHSGYKELTHRDYLGSLTGLGIKREAIGDILVTKRGADIIVLKQMTDFLLANYDKAGRAYLDIEVLELKDLIETELVTEEKNRTVASLRLDNVIAAAFGLSRTKAAEAVKGGIVFLNSLQCMKPEKQINEGDRIVLRGKGKVILKEIGNSTKKDRIYLTFLVMK